MNFYESDQSCNLQIIEKVLSKAYDRKRVINTEKSPTNEHEGHYWGKLGADVAYYGHWVAADDELKQADVKYANERIKFVINGGQPFANINIKHGLTPETEKYKAMPTTTIQFFSPRCGDNGVLTREKNGLKQLQIFHAPDETADSAINDFYDVIAYSIAKRLADFNQDKQC